MGGLATVSAGGGIRMCRFTHAEGKPVQTLVRDMPFQDNMCFPCFHCRTYIKLTFREVCVSSSQPCVFLADATLKTPNGQDLQADFGRNNTWCGLGMVPCWNMAAMIASTN